MQPNFNAQRLPRGNELFYLPGRLFWVISLLVHLVIFLGLSIFVVLTTQAPRRVAIASAGARTTMFYNADGPDCFDDEEPPGGGSAGLITLSPIGSIDAALPGMAEMPKPVLPQLPSVDGAIGVLDSNDPQIGELPSANGLTQGQGGSGGVGRGAGTGSGDGAGSGAGSGGGGKGETTVFGLRGRGSRFVYVFDRSASMSGYEGRPLAGAKRELLNSLRHLDPVHQFQIVFYNEKPALMNLNPGQPPQLVFADSQGKRLAEQFIGGVVADGGTRHVEALTLALQLRPDVIFFLTDADEPRLSDAELRKIYDRNRGTSINTIEFGSGPSSGQYTFLQKLAAQNNGKHVYVDVTSLPLE